MIIFASVCSAQDIIVKKDGSTIQAKVISVSSTEVTYKKFDNQTGPTYTISIKDLQCINYENGTKDTFVSPGYDPNIVTNEGVTQFSNDKKLLDLYNNLNKKVVTPEMLCKRGKRMKIAGFAIGGTLIAAGLVSIVIGASQDKYNEDLRVYSNSIYHERCYNTDRDIFFYIGYGAIAGGIAVSVPLILRGAALQRKNSPQVHAASVISHDINFNNGSYLNLGIDVLSSNLSYNKTPGIGVRYNF